MKIIENTELKEDIKTQLFELWNKEYPEALQFNTYTEFNDYLDGLVQPKHFYIKNTKDEIVGWFFCFERDDDIWFGLLIHHKFQNQGLGRKLVEKAQSQFTKLNGWIVKDNMYKIYNGKTYKSPLDFYLKFGFNIVPNKYRKTDKISTIKIQWNKRQ